MPHLHICHVITLAMPLLPILPVRQYAEEAAQLSYLKAEMTLKVSHSIEMSRHDITPPLQPATPLRPSQHYFHYALASKATIRLKYAPRLLAIAAIHCRHEPEYARRRAATT